LLEPAEPLSKRTWTLLLTEMWMTSPLFVSVSSHWGTARNRVTAKHRQSQSRSTGEALQTISITSKPSTRPNPRLLRLYCGPCPTRCRPVPERRGRCRPASNLEDSRESETGGESRGTKSCLSNTLTLNIFNHIDQL
jgi:hypothetical protein